MKTNSMLINSVIAIMACFTLPFASRAQTGTLDLSFDTDGIAITDINSGDEYGRSMVIQPDGKIVVAGYCYCNPDAFALVRYNPDGSLDNSFDGDGKVITFVGGTNSSRAHAIALQSDGKIVVAGYSHSGTDNDFALVRYHTDGGLDSAFDNDGMVTTPFSTSSNDRSFSVAIQNNGKIVVAGYYTDPSTDRDFALVRYNTNGSLDNTFNSGGVVTTALAIGVDEVRSINLQSDGKIVAAGFSFDGITRVFALVRYNDTGLLDSTFDADGIVTTNISSNDDAAYSSVLQNDGKIVVAGYTHGLTYGFALTRYNSNGGLDNTFDADGIVITEIGTGADLAYAIAIQNDGKIVAAGNTEDIDSDIAIVRYNANGSLDNTFDTDGKVTTNCGPVGSDDVAMAIALQTDNKIVVAGQSSDGALYDFVVARYYHSGALAIFQTPGTNAAINACLNYSSEQATLHFNQLLIKPGVNVYNSIGQKVNMLPKIYNESVTLHRNQLSNGIYFILVTDDNKTVATFKIFITD